MLCFAVCTNDIASQLTSTATTVASRCFSWMASPQRGRCSGCRRNYQDETLRLLHGYLKKDGTVAPRVSLPQPCTYQLLHCTDSQQQSQSL